MQVRDIVAV